MADMADIKVPVFPESIDEGTIAHWHKKKGDAFQRDEVLVDIETDKVVLEVPAPTAGTITGIIVREGETVKAQQVIAHYEEGGSQASVPLERKEDAAKKDQTAKTVEPAESANAKEAKEAQNTQLGDLQTSAASSSEKLSGRMGPAARRLAQQKGVEVQPTPGGSFITKQDLNNRAAMERVEKRVPMTRLRASLAKRLVESQHQAAMLTTFNEVNMRSVMELRTRYRDAFEKKHNGIRLGFMSFFVKAVCEALHKFPEVNAHIDGDDIVYCNYQDIGIAVSSPRGLVVPILRDAQNMSLADIERGIREYSEKAQQAKLTLEELQGGTFTISNGGVFGSLMSTPIINPPQTGILGMHKTQQRPVAVDGKVVILPMMYLALSYDHRMIDGKTAVQFLVYIKEFLEYPGITLLGL